MERLDLFPVTIFVASHSRQRLPLAIKLPTVITQQPRRPQPLAVLPKRHLQVEPLLIQVLLIGCLALHPALLALHPALPRHPREGELRAMHQL